MEIVGAFGGRERSEELADCRAERIEGACGGFTQQVLEFGEDLLNGVQVGRVFWQEDQLGAGRADEPTNGFALVAAQIVHDNNIAGTQRRDEDLFDIDLKALAVDRTVEKPWGVDAVMAQRSQERCCVPVTVRDLGRKPHAERCPSAPRRHVGLGPGLVDEDQTLRRDPVLILGPLRPPPRHVETVAFASHHGFF